MRIAVTGAAGRLGQRVVTRALHVGHDVVAVDLPPRTDSDGTRLAWRGADLTSLRETRASLAGVSAVVHLAALTHPLAAEEPVVHQTNVSATYNVLVAAEEHDVDAVCLASSVNALGGVYSHRPRYDYFPLDEDHPTYCEDPYSLSKWLGEQQTAAFARRRSASVFTDLRLHGLSENFTAVARTDRDWRELWGWTSFDAAAAAVLLALHRSTPGHRVYQVVSARTTSDVPSTELACRFHPNVPLRAPLPGNSSFYRTTRAEAELGWDPHDEHPPLNTG